MGADGDWTWVMHRQCPDCRADVLGLHRDGLGPRIRAVAGAWRMMLARGAVVTRPPHDASRTWSIVEYACHVRDVFELFEERLRLMLKKRKPPTFADWDQDQAAIDGDYANADPDKVAYALASRAGKVADLLDRVNGAEWDRHGTRSDGVDFTVESMARYLLHDVEHHLWDAQEIVGE